MKNYILDTNVLIENPKSIIRLSDDGENVITIPYAVLLELDKLKKDPRLGHVVAQAVDIIHSNGHVRILEPTLIKSRAGITGDDQVISEVLSCGLDDPILVTNDRILQIKARLHDIASEFYFDSLPYQSESQLYTGFCEPGEDALPNSFLWENGKPVFRGDKMVKVVDYEHSVWGVKPRSVYQNLAMELMLNPSINLTTIQSEAGYGKTYLALACALYLVLEMKDNPFRKVVMVKPVVEIGAKMGFLPGDIEEKMSPYIRYIQDLVGKLHELRPANRIFLESRDQNPRLNPHKFEILPLAYIRGMNLENCVIIVDEMQNLSRNETRALLTRMGEGVKCFCLGDTRQIDNPYLNQSNNGLNWTVKKFKGMRDYAHIVLKGERSRGPITDMVIKSGL